MVARIYILAGGPGAGKTELLNLIKNKSSLNSISPPKYSNRNPRDRNDDVIRTDSKEFDKEEFTFVYSMNNNIYGFKAVDIINCLREKKNVFIILSDIRVIEEFKKFFGVYVSVIYIFRNMNEKELTRILNKRKEKKINNLVQESEDTEKKIRMNRLYLIQRQYVENIALFDHVILNRKNKKMEMYKQLKNIVLSFSQGNINPRPKGPVIFMIAAASGAGKRTLIQAMYSLGKRSIKVIQKATDRPAQDDDGREIIPDVKIDKKIYDINYIFNSNTYGINSIDIWQNVALGQPQIVITNMDEFTQFTNIFGNAAVGVYLHATRTQEEILDLQTKKLKSKEKALAKVAKMEEIHQGYIKNIHLFKHVLLNTIEKEDLWEQMFRMIKFYQN